VKKVQDHYFHKAKQNNYPARSVYKLVEAQQKYKFIRNGGKIIDLGCHPGSWSTYAAELVGPKGMVIGLDLARTPKISKPGMGELVFLQKNINDEELIVDLKKINPFYTVVLSDLAPRTSGHKWTDQQNSLALSRKALEIATRLLGKRGSFYCKVFQGEDYPVFFKEVKQFFKTVKTVKPKSSRTESREVFILGRDFKEKF
jgi:23S rRNA (uridine2552-2'-O)-methyltransferase